jgi:hypothetical protein
MKRRGRKKEEEAGGSSAGRTGGGQSALYETRTEKNMSWQSTSIGGVDGALDSRGTEGGTCHLIGMKVDQE